MHRVDHITSLCCFVSYRLHDDFRVCMNPIKSKCNDSTKAVTGYNDIDILVGYTCKKENFDGRI